jgi:hypothetical protein
LNVVSNKRREKSDIGYLVIHFSPFFPFYPKKAVYWRSPSSHFTQSTWSRRWPWSNEQQRPGCPPELGHWEKNHQNVQKFVDKMSLKN